MPDTKEAFQSAPRAGARGDMIKKYAFGIPACFNPLPARVRGEIFGDLQNRGPSMGFQSAPRAGARGDGERFKERREEKRFNPLPARVRGEIG